MTRPSPVQGKFWQLNWPTHGSSAAAAVRVEDHEVVDVWGRHRDAERTRPWAADTVVNAWSTVKGVVALAFHILVDRGLPDPDAPVRKHWPESRTDTVLGRHLLSHRAGPAAFREPTTAEELADWNSMTTRLADTQPRWEPGTVSGCHALTYGFLVGELIRRVTGTGVRDFLHREVAEPAGADFRIGLSPADNSRLAMLVQPPPTAFQSMFAQLNPVALAVLTNPVVGRGSGRRRALAGRADPGRERSRHGPRGGLPLRGVRLRRCRRRTTAAQRGPGRPRPGGRGPCVDLASATPAWMVARPRSAGAVVVRRGRTPRPEPQAVGHVMNLMGQVIADDPRKVELVQAVCSRL